MKRNLITIIIAAVLLVIFALLLFTFQVSNSQQAVVLTFGKITGPARQPGLHWRLPWPFQQVYKFDNRIQTFEDNYSENLTADNITLLMSVYVGWKISDPAAFLNSFDYGSITLAQNQLQSILTSAKASVVGSNSLSAFVNADPKQLKFDQIQSDIQQVVQNDLRTNSYGIAIEFLGIKQLGLPQNVTTAVFDRMTSERNVLINQLKYDGTRQATIIEANADRQANITLADARAEATRIEGQGVAEVAKTLPTFEKNPDLAVFQLRLKAYEDALNQKSTVIFDQHMPPFDLFQSLATNGPAQ